MSERHCENPQESFIEKKARDLLQRIGRASLIEALKPDFFSDSERRLMVRAMIKDRRLCHEFYRLISEYDLGNTEWYKNIAWDHADHEIEQIAIRYESKITDPNVRIGRGLFKGGSPEEARRIAASDLLQLGTPADKIKFLECRQINSAGLDQEGNPLYHYVLIIQTPPIINSVDQARRASAMLSKPGEPRAGIQFIRNRKRDV